jgi:hypothetical protein
MRGVPFHRPHAAPGLLVHSRTGGRGPSPHSFAPADPGRPGRSAVRGSRSFGPRARRGIDRRPGRRPLRECHGSDDPMHDHRGDRRGSEVVIGSSHSDPPFESGASFIIVSAWRALLQVRKVQNRFAPASPRARGIRFFYFSTIAPVICTSWSTWKALKSETPAAHARQTSAPATDGRSPPLQSVTRNSPSEDFEMQPMETKLSPRSIDLG